MVNTHDIVGPLFAGIPDPSTILLTVGVIIAVVLFVGMAVAGRGH